MSATVSMQAPRYEPMTINKDTIMTKADKIRMTESGAIRLTDDDSSIEGRGALQCEAKQQADVRVDKKRTNRGRKEKDSSSAPVSTGKPLTRLTANQRAFAEHLAASLNSAGSSHWL